METTLLKKEKSQIVVSIDSFQFYTTLLHQGLVKPFFKTFVVNIPPGYTVDWIIFNPAGYYSLFVEILISIFPDHVLEASLYTDGEFLFYDPDAVQDRYREPINFPRRLGAIKPVKNYWRLILKNKSATEIVYASALVSYGSISKELYDTVYEKFFEVLAEALSLPLI
jgi:hypothetical protein